MEFFSNVSKLRDKKTMKDSQTNTEQRGPNSLFIIRKLIVKYEQSNVPLMEHLTDKNQTLLTSDIPVDSFSQPVTFRQENFKKIWQKSMNKTFSPVDMKME
jgi:hypothetical protein